MESFWVSGFRLDLVRGACGRVALWLLCHCDNVPNTRCDLHAARHAVTKNHAAHLSNLCLSSSSFNTLEEFIAESYIKGFSKSKPENLLCQLETWYAHDVSLNNRYEGQLQSAMRSVKAKVLFAPCETDR
jgi:hypothetical protein